MKVLRRLPPRPTTPIPGSPVQLSTPFEAVTSSPPDADTLHTATVALNRLVTTRAPLDTPARKFVNRLTQTAERQQAEISILRRERDNIRQILSSRKERLSGKRLILKGKSVVTSVEIQTAIAAKEKETKERKNRKKLHQRRGRTQQTEPRSESEDEDDPERSTQSEIGDCIQVERP